MVASLSVCRFASDGVGIAGQPATRTSAPAAPPLPPLCPRSRSRCRPRFRPRFRPRRRPRRPPLARPFAAILVRHFNRIASTITSRSNQTISQAVMQKSRPYRSANTARYRLPKVPLQLAAPSCSRRCSHLQPFSYVNQIALLISLYLESQLYDHAGMACSQLLAASCLRRCHRQGSPLLTAACSHSSRTFISSVCSN